MIAQISPQETFPIVYVLSDPTDTGTYFVRSVVRNSVTGAIIRVANANFVNLTNGGNRRFTKTIQAPNDPSGQGLWVDITTTVYTDSDYTTKSDRYQEQNDRYIVQTRWNTSLGNGGGSGGAGLDIQMIEKLLVLLFEKYKVIVPPLDLSPALVRLQGLYTLLGDVATAIGGIDIPKPEKVNLEAFSGYIVDMLSREIKNIQFPAIDYTPVLEKIGAIEFPEILPAKDYTKDITRLEESLAFLKGQEEGRLKNASTTTRDRILRLQGRPISSNQTRIQALI